MKNTQPKIPLLLHNNYYITYKKPQFICTIYSPLIPKPPRQSDPCNKFPCLVTSYTRPEPLWQKIAQSPLNSTTQPVDIEEEGRNPTIDRQV